MPTQISLTDCTAAILSEIADNMPQKCVASTYAMAIMSWNAGVDIPDWTRINGAIADRWSAKAVGRIKRLAWGIVEGESQSRRAAARHGARRQEARRRHAGRAGT